MLLAISHCGLLALILIDSPTRPELPPLAPLESFTPDERSHWAYQVPNRPTPLQVEEPGWIRNPIDRFLLAGLESAGLCHAPEADRGPLLRRVTFDLTGLPPSPEELASYLDDERPDAYDRLVDRLLESPRYGQRWAQHWLDLAHYADSNGFDGDADRPDAWRYRDWVVDALNADMPYDRFVALQLAGDEAAPGDPSALIATGFARCGPRDLGMGKMDLGVKRQEELTEVTGTVGSVFLGLTVGCARCHDHKFDALPTADYYRLQSFFAAAKLADRPIASKAEAEAYAAAKKVTDERIAGLGKKIVEFEEPYRKELLERRKAMLGPSEVALLSIPEKDRTPEQRKLIAGFETSLRIPPGQVAEAIAKDPAASADHQRLKAEFQAARLAAPRPPANAMALVDEGRESPETYVARRGDIKNVGHRVAPRPPGIVLASQPPSAFEDDAIRPTDSTTGRRLALARWLIRPDNPLTARVMVNRLWHHHFGRGIVTTPSDFGVRGEPPSHPGLLDWLATELVAQGWRLKPIHRLMVTSAAYRQSSDPPPGLAREGSARDPDNTRLWRMNRRRMEAEGLRDAMLAVSGELNPKAGGPGILAAMEKEVEDLIFTTDEKSDRWHEDADPAEHLRRSLYLFRKRNVRYPLFDAFDAPDSQTACPRRVVSTHALQALMLMNGDFASSRARALAGRILGESSGSDESRIVRSYRIVLARDPDLAEVAQALDFLRAQAALIGPRLAEGRPVARPSFVLDRADPATAAAWVDFSRAMLNRNEFLYVP
jgi:Protein of unknown function (DUF1553)/Protein of unknown function (DUF1549)